MSRTLCNHLALRQTMRLVGQLYDAELAPSGLKTTQFSMLTILAREGPLTVHALAQHMLVDRTTLTRNLQPLEREGWLEMATGKDRRQRVISLTAAGRAKRKEAHPLWGRAQRRFEEAVGGGQAEALREELARINEAVAPLLRETA
ncbi:MarR family winged helix-turn-helix transcriptional regulator [Gemmatimonas sp.]|jgi:DNA-binding MarR family transcriptional regulator|uniref:MarR family winged helix-turn-helix transcriptional regulator n=1 Tax=Gemmatimonas sp. TaxID=1962908 RepID=UPI0025BB8F16|nr:MarR family transcriptional regulator [Gemmatimonas sp.]MCA2988717.1 MarR family transcriptional regulator [Gemmatimonas sp.]